MEVLGQRYRDAGLVDVTVRLYDGARHEILNEINRHEVTADVVAWPERTPATERTTPLSEGDPHPATSDSAAIRASQRATLRQCPSTDR